MLDGQAPKDTTAQISSRQQQYGQNVVDERMISGYGHNRGLLGFRDSLQRYADPYGIKINMPDNNKTADGDMPRGIDNGIGGDGIEHFYVNKGIKLDDISFYKGFSDALEARLPSMQANVSAEIGPLDVSSYTEYDFAVPGGFWGEIPVTKDDLFGIFGPGVKMDWEKADTDSKFSALLRSGIKLKDLNYGRLNLGSFLYPLTYPGKGKLFHLNGGIDIGKGCDAGVIYRRWWGDGKGDREVILLQFGMELTEDVSLAAKVLELDDKHHLFLGFTYQGNAKE